MLKANSGSRAWLGGTAVLSLALFAYPSRAQPIELALSMESATPGGSVYFPVRFISGTRSISALQFDVHYVSSAMSLVALVGNATRVSGKSLYQAEVSPGRQRFVIVGLNQNSIQDGVLIGLLANLGPGTANGTYPLKLSDVFGCDEEGRGAPGTATDGSVTIREGPGEILRLRPEGVLNGASLMTGSVAPGQILTLIGSGIGPEREQVPDPLPSSTTLRGVSVLFDGSPAPLLYASRSQINVIAPFRLESGTFTELRIAGVGQTLATITLPVTAASPSIFTLDASGVGPGAILNQDSTVNSGSNPADRGSVVVIFAMGAGQTDPPGKDGEVPVNPPPKPILPVSAEIGGIEAEILFAGSAPGLVSGVLQVNCRVPTGLVPSLTAPVLLRVGTAVSQPGVTLAIR